MKKSDRKEIAILAALVIAGGGLAALLASPPAHSAPPPAITCQEDDPCWNPDTMGNGLGTLPGVGTVAGEGISDVPVTAPVTDPLEVVLGRPTVPVSSAPTLAELLLGTAR